MNSSFLVALEAILDKENILINEPMKKHTTFRVGGEADYYLMPDSVDSIVSVIQLCKKEDMPYYIVGNGSNLLVSDDGYRGAIIEIGNKFSRIDVEGNTINIQAGAKLNMVAVKALENSLTGFEFAHGIPGTIGGAVTMNAGAYGGEMKDVLKSITAVNQEGNVIEIAADGLELGYRHSIVPEQNLVVVGATIELKPGNSEEIKAMMDDLAFKRRDKQPLEYPSAGSTFKRPEGYFAGKLIEDAGLKGYRRGGAMVSEKHSGFVINYDNATARDVINVINDVRDKVNEIYGVHLETEVKIL